MKNKRKWSLKPTEFQPRRIVGTVVPLRYACRHRRIEQQRSSLAGFELSCMSRFSLFVCATVIAFSASAQEGDRPKATIDFSLYPYQHTLKDDVDFSVMMNASLPGRFSYFAYANMKGSTTGESAVFDRSEQNLRYSISDNLPLDLNFQAILIRGDGNDFYQLGLSWRIHDTPVWQQFFDRINLIYRLTFQLKRYSVDDRGAWQMEHFFKMTFPDLSDRLYFSGFVDQTFNQDLPDTMPRNPVVAELQLGLRMFDRFYAITEYRVNQWRVGDEYNLAVGVEYKVRW